MIAAPPLPAPTAPAPVEIGPAPTNGDSSGGSGDTIPDETDAINASAFGSGGFVAGGRRRTAGERLAAIDARLLVRITDAADVAVRRMVDRAGQRIVSTLAGDHSPSAARAQARDLIRHVDKSRVAATLGRDRLATLAIDAEEILTADLADLEQRWEVWLREAQREARRISRVRLDLGDEEEAALEARQDEHRNAAWIPFAATVLTVARSSLFETTRSSGAGPSGGPAGGRVAPGVVRDALAKAGGSTPVTAATGTVRDVVTGGPVGLVATGDDIGGLWGAHGEAWTEYEWVHDDPLSPFPWHEDLHGVRFSTFDEESLSTSLAPDLPASLAADIGPFFFVGDHAGCLCVIEPVTD